MIAKNPRTLSDGLFHPPRDIKENRTRMKAHETSTRRDKKRKTTGSQEMTYTEWWTGGETERSCGLMNQHMTEIKFLPKPTIGGETSNQIIITGRVRLPKETQMTFLNPTQFIRNVRESDYEDSLIVFVLLERIRNDCDF